MASDLSPYLSGNFSAFLLTSAQISCHINSSNTRESRQQGITSLARLPQIGHRKGERDSPPDSSRHFHKQLEGIPSSRHFKKTQLKKRSLQSPHMSFFSIQHISKPKKTKIKQSHVLDFFLLLPVWIIFEGDPEPGFNLAGAKLKVRKTLDEAREGLRHFLIQIQSSSRHNKPDLGRTHISWAVSLSAQISLLACKC